MQTATPAPKRCNILGFQVDLAAYEQAARRQEQLAARVASRDPARAAAFRWSAHLLRADAAWMARGCAGMAPSLRPHLQPLPRAGT